MVKELLKMTSYCKALAFEANGGSIAVIGSFIAVEMGVSGVFHVVY